ncbi:MAG: hypothetical protein AAGC82_07400 [Pseudomonadota bacterium]
MMRKIDRRSTLAGLGLGLVGWGVPGFGQETDRRRPEGGIGGTGIVGTLTDFGSIVVNGLRIETDAPGIVTDAYGAFDVADLSLGHSLTIEAAANDAGLLSAARIHVTQPVVGRVGYVAPDGRSGLVGGTNVVLEAGAIGTLEPGQQVAVSGLWRGRTVIAARIDLADGKADALAGAVETTTATEAIIAGRRVALGRLARPVIGTFATVIGRQNGPLLEAASLSSGRFFGAAGALSSLSVEGYLQARSGAPFFEVSGLGHSFDREAALQAFAGRRTLFDGQYDGDFRVETGLLLPEDVSARQRLGQAILAGGEVARISAR